MKAGNPRAAQQQFGLEEPLHHLQYMQHTNTEMQEALDDRGAR